MFMVISYRVMMAFCVYRSEIFCQLKYTRKTCENKMLGENEGYPVSRDDSFCYSLVHLQVYILSFYVIGSCGSCSCLWAYKYPFFAYVIYNIFSDSMQHHVVYICLGLSDYKLFLYSRLIGLGSPV